MKYYAQITTDKTNSDPTAIVYDCFKDTDPDPPFDSQEEMNNWVSTNGYEWGVSVWLSRLEVRE